MTGQHLAGTPRTMRHDPEAIARIYRLIFPVQQQSHHKPAGSRPDDEALLRKARAASNGAKFQRLFEGDTSLHQGNNSSADMALCQMLAFWTGPDAERIDRLFRQSKLYRSKWERTDYRQRTINKAIAICRQFYHWDRAPSKGNDPAAGRTPPPPPPQGAADTIVIPKINLTDRGNGIRLVQAHGQDLRHCWPWKKWLVWDAAQWRIDAGAELASKAKMTLVDLLRSTCAQIEMLQSGDQARLAQLHKIQQHCLKSEAAPRIHALIDLARSEPGIPLLPDRLDLNPWLLNCPNGTLDLRSGTLREHRREDYITKFCPVPCDPAALCPTWERFLSEILDPAVAEYLQRFVGYCLTSIVSEQCLW